MGQKEMAMTGKNRIMIYGPKNDGTYIVEFRTAAGEALTISVGPAPPVALCLMGSACRMFDKEPLARSRVSVSGALQLSPPNPYMRVPEIPPVLPHTRAGFRLANDTLLRTFSGNLSFAAILFVDGLTERLHLGATARGGASRLGRTGGWP